MDPELIEFLNHRLSDIFDRVTRGEKEAFEDYFQLLLFETSTLLLHFGVEPEACADRARHLLDAILKRVSAENLPDIVSKGAFVWWRSKLNPLIASYYADEAA